MHDAQIDDSSKFVPLRQKQPQTMKRLMPVVSKMDEQRYHMERDYNKGHNHSSSLTRHNDISNDLYRKQDYSRINLHEAEY